MARPLRIEFPGAPYHMSGRGNARADIVGDDDDRRIFVDALSATVERFGWLCKRAGGRRRRWRSCAVAIASAATG